MLILASATDKLQIITGSAGSINVHASYLDNVAGTVSPGRQNTFISVATTTDVVSSPVAAVFRNLKTLHVYNGGATANSVTVQHTDGTTTVQLHHVNLAAGATLQYVDEIGFLIPESRPPGQTVLIENKTITTPVATVDFIKGIDATYDQFHFRLYNLRTSGDLQQACMRISTDLGVTWRTDASYIWVYNYWPPTVSTPVVGYTVEGFIRVTLPIPSVAAGQGNLTYIDFAQPAVAGPQKLFKMEHVAFPIPSSGVARMDTTGMYWDGFAASGSVSGGTSPAINAIRFLPSLTNPAVNFTGGSFNLYGITK